MQTSVVAQAKSQHAISMSKITGRQEREMVKN